MKQQGWAGWKKLFGAWVGATADGSLPARATAARCGGDRAAHFCRKVKMKLAAATLPFAGPRAHVARAAASAGASHQSHHEEEPHATRGTDQAAKRESKDGGRAQSVVVRWAYAPRLLRGATPGCSTRECEHVKREQRCGSFTCCGSFNVEGPHATRGTDQAANGKGQRGWVGRRVRVGCEMVRSMSSGSIHYT